MGHLASPNPRPKSPIPLAAKHPPRRSRRCHHPQHFQPPRRQNRHGQHRTNPQCPPSPPPHRKRQSHPHPHLSRLRPLQKSPGRPLHPRRIRSRPQCQRIAQKHHPHPHRREHENLPPDGSANQPPRRLRHPRSPNPPHRPRYPRSQHIRPANPPYSPGAACPPPSRRFISLHLPRSIPHAPGNVARIECIAHGFPPPHPHA